MRASGRRLAGSAAVGSGLWAIGVSTKPGSLALGLVPMRTAAAGQRDFLLLPMHDTFLECLSLDRTEAPSAPVTVARDRIEPPRKVRHVAPVYPPLARDSRRQGIAIIESTISVHGCVSRAEVSRSAGIDFDVSAVTAVTGWKFTPTLLSGKPVPVIMTLTVQFTLQ